MNGYRALVGGRFVDLGPDGDTIVDPANENVVAHVGHADEALVEAAIVAADEAFRSVAWRRTTPAERSALLHAIADRVAGAADELAAIEVVNVGMPIVFAEAIVASCVDTLRFFAGAARTMDGLPTAEYVPGITSFLRREPIGVVGQLLPWNVPLLMAAWKVGPALAAGNAVVLKPSRRTPLSLLRFGDLVADLVPPGVVNIVPGRHEVVAGALARSPLVRMIALTGSVAAGVSVGALSAATVKRLHLELGGNTPVIVCADADLDAAAEGIVRGALDNAGQDCTAASRVLVEAGAMEALVGRLVEAVGRVRVGDPRDRATQMGPVIGADRREAILGLLERAREEGAEVVRGGRVLPARGWFLEPALVIDPDGRTSVTREEVFGPVITVERWADLDEAVERANAGEHGLAAGIWTGSLSQALVLAARLEAGKVWINEHHRDATEMPHGGQKLSGHGSDLSTIALLEYTTPKAVHARIDRA